MYGRVGGATSWLRKKKSPIEQVVDRGEIAIVYQPLVDLANGSTFAYEALLRCTSPAYTSPLDMFKDAVEADCVCELGQAARRLAVESCEEWPLFLNVHPNEFDEGLLVQPNDPIFYHSHPIYLEITESVPLSHFELCHSVLSEVRSKGIRLAIDDLGAGYSNLKYIADLAPEVVKIDRGLVMELGADARHRRLVKHIVDLCEGMGAKVVAEGIETVDELMAVMDAGADFGQGFLLARPAYPPPSIHWPEEAAARGKKKKTSRA